LWWIQIDEVLMDDEKCEALVTHVDHLLITCTLQLRVTYSKHMSLHVDSSAGSAQQHNVLSLYKCLLATFHTVSPCTQLFCLAFSTALWYFELLCISDQCSNCMLWCNQTCDQSDLLKFVHNKICAKHFAFIIKSRSARMHVRKICLRGQMFVSHAHEGRDVIIPVANPNGQS